MEIRPRPAQLIELRWRLESGRAFVVEKRWDVDLLGDIRIAQGEDLEVGHRCDNPASINIPLTLSLRGWRDGCGRGDIGSCVWGAVSLILLVCGGGGG